MWLGSCRTRTATIAWYVNIETRELLGRMIPQRWGPHSRLLQGLWYTQVLQTPLVLWQSAGLLELLQWGWNSSKQRNTKNTPKWGRSPNRTPTKSICQWMQWLFQKRANELEITAFGQVWRHWQVCYSGRCQAVFCSNVPSAKNRISQRKTHNFFLTSQARAFISSKFWPKNFYTTIFAWSDAWQINERLNVTWQLNGNKDSLHRNGSNQKPGSTWIENDTANRRTSFVEWKEELATSPIFLAQ